jgi:hypothetical protein
MLRNLLDFELEVIDDALQLGTPSIDVRSRHFELRYPLITLVGDLLDANNFEVGEAPGDVYFLVHPHRFQISEALVDDCRGLGELGEAAINNDIVGTAITIQISEALLPLGVMIVEATVEFVEEKLQIRIHSIEFPLPAGVVVVDDNGSRVQGEKQSAKKGGKIEKSDMRLLATNLGKIVSLGGRQSRIDEDRFKLFREFVYNFHKHQAHSLFPSLSTTLWASVQCVGPVFTNGPRRASSGLFGSHTSHVASSAMLIAKQENC